MISFLHKQKFKYLYGLKMTRFNHHCSMRPVTIIDYFLRDQKARNLSWSLLNERDDLHRALNKQYNLTDRDGNFGIGKYGSDHVYQAQYDLIEKKYQAKYDDIYTHKRTKDCQELSVWEYLLFDNIGSEEKKEVFKIADAYKHDEWHDFLSVRAEAEINFYVREYNVGGIRKRIAHEKHMLGYGASRCRRDLKISLLDISAQRAIFYFKFKYIRRLNQLFESQHLS